MTYKQRLAQVRQNDAIHQKKMQSIADAAGVRLSAVRAAGPKVCQLDKAMNNMIYAAAQKGVTYENL